jgi:nicotinamidase-related amidase
MGSDLRFGPLGPQAVHLCVDMQTLFAERTDWHVPWLLPPVTRLAQAPRERTVFTRLCRPNGQKMPWARGGVILRTGAR